MRPRSPMRSWPRSARSTSRSSIEPTLFNAWRTAIEAAATEGPLTVVLEDLHWSSDSLLDLLDSLVQPRPDLPILIVAVARPELLDRRASWSGGRRNSLSLSLEPLADVDVATLVEHLVEGIAPDVVEAVVERADGNPFYAGRDRPGAGRAGRPVPRPGPGPRCPAAPARYGPGDGPGPTRPALGR